MAAQISHVAAPGLKPTFRILLADDSPESQALIRCYLAGPLYQIEVAGNGDEAVALFQSRSFDLVLIDQHMPIMDGFEATRVIRAWEASHQRNPTPVIALTAESSLDAEKQSYAAGCTACIAKPISKKKLLDALQTYSAPSSMQLATAQGGSSAGVAALIDDEIARRRPLFLNNRHQDLDRMKDAIQRGDYEVIRITGHRIKGLAGSYGFPEIGLAGAQLEQAAKNRDVDSIRQTIDELATMLARAGQAA